MLKTLARHVGGDTVLAMPESPRNLDDLARDAARVAVGLGLIGFQRAQVKRRDLERSLTDTPIANAVQDATGALGAIHRGTQQALDAVESAVPDPAGSALGLARTVVDDAGRAISSRLGPWLR